MGHFVAVVKGPYGGSASRQGGLHEGITAELSSPNNKLVIEMYYDQATKTERYRLTVTSQPVKRVYTGELPSRGW